jgi:hypothetical protein
MGPDPRPESEEENTMPRKPNEGAPKDESAKLTDEARKEIFGRSELESDEEGTSEGRDRQFSGPSSAESRAAGSKNKQST